MDYPDDEEVMFEPDIEYDSNGMVNPINADVIAIFDIMFWRGVANPQSGEMYDCKNEIYDL